MQLGDPAVWVLIASALSKGLLVTVELTVLASGVALVLAFLSGTAQLAPWGAVRIVARVYIETFRGSSAIVQLFFLYYALPLFGVSLSAFVVGVLGLGLNVGAYASQIVRAGIEAVDRGQRDASIALGFSGWWTLTKIVIPQALPLMLPPFGNELIDMLKLTSLASLITLTDLTSAGRHLVEANGHGPQVYLALLVTYYVLAFPIALLIRNLERRNRRGGLVDLSEVRPV